MATGNATKYLKTNFRPRIKHKCGNCKQGHGIKAANMPCQIVTKRGLCECYCNLPAPNQIRGL